MNDNVNQAFQLFLVGMSTVFLILGIVVMLGRFLIFMVNKYSKVPAKPSTVRKTSSLISSKKIAVLSTVVAVVTQQRGVIKSIKKL